MAAELVAVTAPASAPSLAEVPHGERAYLTRMVVRHANAVSSYCSDAFDTLVSGWV